MAGANRRDKSSSKFYTQEKQMKKLILILVVLVGAVSAVTWACWPPPAEFDDSKFTIRFPPNAGAAEDYDSNPDSESTMHHRCVKLNGLTYQISYLDHPNVLSKSEMEEILAPTKTLVGLKKWEMSTLAGSPSIQATTKQHGIFMVSRYLIVERQRLYILTVGGFKSFPLKPKTGTEFFDSFKIEE